jgi:hypothetical protein
MKKIISFLESCLRIFSGEKESFIVVASQGTTAEEPNFFNNETVNLEEISRPTLMFERCGHYGSKKFRFNIWGNSRIAELKNKFVTKKNGKRVADGLCPKCFFEKMKESAIRCCLCGYGILPYDEVALYHKKSVGIKKGVATFIGNRAVGCLLYDCCLSGAFFAGHWSFEGFKPTFSDGRTALEEAVSSKSIVMINNT